MNKNNKYISTLNNMYIKPESESNNNLIEKIKFLQKKMKAIILAHYYQNKYIQKLANFVGDSLDLSRQASSTNAQIIIFAGVRFMAETAKILNPNRLVLLPDIDAGCSLEKSCSANELVAFRKNYPNYKIITYINSSIEVKALSDIIVTSSNAEYIIKQFKKESSILFVPDRNLGEYLNYRLNIKMILWPGSCIVHESFSLNTLFNLKQQYPQAVLAAHPECPQIILQLADHIGSTKSLLNFVATTSAKEIIIATEANILHQMKQLAKNKVLILLSNNKKKITGIQCPYMAKNTLTKLYLCMLNQTPRIEISDELITRAKKPLELMLNMSPPI